MRTPPTLPGRNRRCTRWREGSMASILALCMNAAPSLAQSAATNGKAHRTNSSPQYEVISTNTPPLPPARFNPDPGSLRAPANVLEPEVIPQLRRGTNFSKPPQPPPLFNPDPGAMVRPPSTNRTFFTNEFAP